MLTTLNAEPKNVIAITGRLVFFFLFLAPSRISVGYVFRLREFHLEFNEIKITNNGRKTAAANCRRLRGLRGKCENVTIEIKEKKKKTIVIVALIGQLKFIIFSFLCVFVPF